MKLKSAFLGFALLSCVYLGVLVWADSGNQVFSAIPKLAVILPVLALCSFGSYLLRYLRWYWLLKKAGCQCAIAKGFLTYLTGFAFTATPGKVGELIRIRYFAREGIPSWQILAAFVYERAFDLIVVLCLASLYISRIDILLTALGFVVFLIAALLTLTHRPAWLTLLALYCRRLRMAWAGKIVITLRNGIKGCKQWLNPTDIIISFTLGLLAWLLVAYSFTLLLSYFDITLPVNAAISIYPLAMLAGAASMIPGGIGSTELAIVVLLSFFGISLEIATIIAVGIRIASLWFAIFCGFLAISILEYKHNKALS